MITQTHVVFVVVNTKTADVEGVFETSKKANRFAEGKKDVTVVRRAVR